MLSFSASGPGVGSIRVNATDGIAEPVEAAFRVSAHSPGAKMAEAYPDVVSDKLTVHSTSASQFKVQIYNSTGRCVYNASIKPDPYKPYEINVAGLAPGRYTVAISGNQGTVKKTILKI